MHLDSGVLLHQTERGSVRLATGQQQLQQQQERPSLRVVRTGLQDRTRERENTRDSDAPGEAVLSVQQKIRGVGLRQGHRQGLHVQGDLVGVQGRDYCGGEKGSVLL